MIAEEDEEASCKIGQTLFLDQDRCKKCCKSLEVIFLSLVNESFMEDC